MFYVRKLKNLKLTHNGFAKQLFFRTTNVCAHCNVCTIEKNQSMAEKNGRKTHKIIKQLTTMLEINYTGYGKNSIQPTPLNAFYNKNNGKKTPQEKSFALTFFSNIIFYTTENTAKFTRRPLISLR